MALLAHSIQQIQEPIQGSQEQGIWQAAFHAGQLSAPIGTIAGKPVDKAQLLRRLQKGIKPMRSELPLAPKWHHELASYPFGDLFVQAELKHLQTHKEMQSWTEMDWSDLTVQGKQVIQCM